MKSFSIVILSLLISLSANAQLIAPENREAIFQKAKVWFPPSTPISQVDFKKTKGGELDGQVIDCDFKPGNLSGGVTPKFKCVITSGIFKDRIIKVKYGPGDDNEISNEVFGMRLMNALGFGIDDVYLPKEVRCKGCPKIHMIF